MGRKLDENTIKQIFILYEQLNNQAEVARRLGISQTTVRRYLSLGAAATLDSTSTSTSTSKKTKITPEMEEEINKRYQECRNMSQVAREFGITPATVKNHLNKESLSLNEREKDDRDALFYYIYKLFGPVSEDQPVSKHNIVQMQKFRKQGMPYQGQLLTLKYFYEVEGHTTERSNGSIGIVPYAYSRAKLYYTQQAAKAAQINAAIQHQLEQDRIVIPFNPNDFFSRKKKKTIDLNTIGE